MSLFKKSKEKIEAEKLYDLLSDKTKNFSLNEIKKTISSQGYSDKVLNLVVGMIQDNKLPLKNESRISPETDAVLRELRESIKKSKEINSNKEKEINAPKIDNKTNDNKTNVTEIIDKKETTLKSVSKQNKVGFLTKTKNFFKKIYFFFEDNYYKGVDSVSKVVPVNNLTDRIDKFFPSFILFLLIIALLLYLIFSGTLSFTKTWTLSVEVYDPSNVPLNNAQVVLQVKDKNISSLDTDIFGEVIFKDFKSKRGDITLIVSKQYFNTQIDTFKINKNSLRRKIILTIDTEYPIIPSNDPKEREISFVENNNVLITNTTLNLTFACTNTEKFPDPKNTLISNGRVLVKTPGGCGDLRVSVTSNQFLPITNKVIGQDNKVVLTRTTLDRGTLGVSVKNLLKAPITSADTTVYNNSQSTSTLPIDSKTTDIYGLTEFSLEPKEYLLTVSKEGYLTYPKKGPLNIIKDLTTNTDIVLFTKQELIDFDCSDSKYSDFCINGNIDCLNEHLKPFLKMNPDGTCDIGNPGYISVTLIDANTSLPVFADITLDSKIKDSDQNYSMTEHIAQDTNHYVFDVIDFYDYRVRVINTEENGYLSPDPITIDHLDINITVPLEFSSELNSGDIKVNVKNNEINISNSRVYLYREFEDEFILVNSEPKLTNQFGDVNFNLQRANRDYYAYSIHNVIDKQGTSDIKKLDVNSLLELDINLEDITKTLNLRVIPNIEYDINFYDSLHNQITDYVSLNIDQNKQYFFTGPINNIYAIINSPGYTSYQTDLITLIPDQEVFKQVSLTLIEACDNTKIELLGLYDKTGNLVVENIDFINHNLSDEYRLKFKYTSCLKDADFKQVHIRTGNQLSIVDDYLSLVSESILLENIDVTRGYRFSGEHIPDFNLSLFDNYYLDRGAGYSGDDYKWLEIDLLDIPVDILEFSVNFKFKESPIAPIEFYKIGYRSIATKFNSSYNYYPQLPESWNNIPFYPDGYFYSKTNTYQIPFENTDYIYQTKIKDWNGNLLEPNAHGYTVDIDSFYKYDLYYLYLKDELRNENILQSSQYTNNNLGYLSYGYLSSEGNSQSGGSSQNPNQPLLITGLPILPFDQNNPVNPEIYYHIEVNDLNYSLNNILADRGYFINKFTIFKPEGFFETTSYSDPEITTNILNNFPNIKIPIYAYYSDTNFIFEITTDDSNNDLFVGQNNVSFKVLDNFANPVENVLIKYMVLGDEIISLGRTNQQGELSNQSINLLIDDVSKKINFYFIFTSEYGFSQNTILREKDILSGYSILEDNLESSISYYRFNDQLFSIDKNTPNYNLLKKSTISSIFEDISFLGEDNIFDISQINENISSLNNIPKNIISPNTTILTDIVLSDNINYSGDSLGIYRNTIKLNQEVTLLFDINSNVVINDLGNITTDINYPHPKRGVEYISSSDVFNVELIKDVNPEITFNLDIVVDNNAVLENININNIPSFIDNESLSVLEDISNEDINSQGYTLAINFKIDDSYQGLFPINSAENIIITFNILIGNEQLTFNKEFNIKAHNKDSIVSISTENNDHNVNIFCTTNNCSLSKEYRFIKNTDLYNIFLITQDSVIIPDNDDLDISGFYLVSDLLLTETQNTRNVIYSSDYDVLSDQGASGDLDISFNFNVLDVNYFNRLHPLTYNITKVDSIEFENNVDIDYCIGVGGMEQENNIFILGYCEDIDLSCMTGSNAVPKIFYNWGEEPVNWTEECVGDDLDDVRSNKYACDSLQMLISTFYMINHTDKSEFYIKLMNDGISDSLLKDFIDYRENDSSSQYAKFNLPNNTDLFTEQAVDAGEFKIIINNDTSIKQFQPGIYKVTVYGKSNELYINSAYDEKIDIRLDFESNILPSEISVFHYMPFNGGLNIEERDGYGVKTQNNQEPINLNLFTEINYENVNNPIQIVQANNNNNLSGFSKILNSDGVILDVEKLPDNYIKLEYTPSYPIPIYAHAACILDYNFSYSLFENNNSLNSIIQDKLLKWNYNNSILSDRYMSIGDGRTMFSLNTEGLTNESINIDTFFYLPTSFDISTINLRTTDLFNNDNSRIFTKTNLTGTKDISFATDDHSVSNDLEQLRTLNGIFDFIKDEKACIYKSIERTYIKWIDQEVNFTAEQLQQIQENIPSDYICNSQGNIDPID